MICFEKTSKILILKNSEIFNTFKQFSWIGAITADFGSGDPGSNLEGSKFFSKFIHIFAFLKSYG